MELFGLLRLVGTSFGRLFQPLPSSVYGIKLQTRNVPRLGSEDTNAQALVLALSSGHEGPEAKTVGLGMSGLD